jgi:protein-disulfide isomerase-like protein with CxxC motif
MTMELFFIYDTHCPWSYATTPLLNEISKAFPQIDIFLWHNAYYDGETKIDQNAINEVVKASGAEFGQTYLDNLDHNKDSTYAANLMTWVQNKEPKQALTILNNLQRFHFNLGNELDTKESMEALIKNLKLSPPSKILKNDKLTNDAEAVVHEIFALQDVIQTKAIPALLLAINDELILFNHNLYLDNPKDILGAVKLEIEKHG